MRMSNSSRLQKRQVQAAIQSQIIPLLQRGAAWMLFDVPPQEISRGRPNIKITEHAARALPARRGKGDDVRIRQWYSDKLNAANVPYWGCVVEGEADLAVGITENMCEERGIAPKRWTIELPAGTIFWALPGVPLSMGGEDGVHWERPHPENAYSRIFWMHVTPMGASCHFCTSEAGKHWSHPHVFIPTREIWQVGQRISDELKSTFEQRQLMLEYLLRILLIYTLRGMDKQPETPISIENITPNHEGYLDHEQVIQGALAYIDENYHKAKLTVANIAEHVHLSPTHLGRLFRKHLRCTVKEVILNTRFERARILLEDSTYNIGQIATHCGYVHSSSFIAAFEKRYKKSPLTYRHEHSK